MASDNNTAKQAPKWTLQDTQEEGDQNTWKRTAERSVHFSYSCWKMEVQAQHRAGLGLHIQVVHVQKLNGVIRLLYLIKSSTYVRYSTNTHLNYGW